MHVILDSTVVGTRRLQPPRPWVVNAPRTGKSKIACKVLLYHNVVYDLYDFNTRMFNTC